MYTWYVSLHILLQRVLLRRSWLCILWHVQLCHAGSEHNGLPALPES